MWSSSPFVQLPFYPDIRATRYHRAVCRVPLFPANSVRSLSFLCDRSSNDFRALRIIFFLPEKPAHVYENETKRRRIGCSPDPKSLSQAVQWCVTVRG